METRIETATAKVAEAEKNLDEARSKLSMEQDKSVLIGEVRRARKNRDKAHAALLEAMHAADAAGVTVHENMTAAGVSRRTFYKWIREGGKPPTPRY